MTPPYSSLLITCLLTVPVTYLRPSLPVDRLVGLVVKASAGFESRLRRDFFGVESYQ